MQSKLWVATRKGLFGLERRGGSGGGWTIAKTAFLGDNVSLVLPDARDGSVYAALGLGHFGAKLRRSDDGGATWTECAVPEYPKGDAETAPALKQFWSLEAAGPCVEDGVWAGTAPGGLFLSRDRGATWELNRPLWDRPERSKWFGGGTEHPAIHSIGVDPRDPRCVTVAVSCGGVAQTRDGGATWASRSEGMFAEFMPPDQQRDPDIQDPHGMVQCVAAPDCLWVQHHNGIFRSTDHAASWQHITGIKPSCFGFAVAVHPHDPQTAWFVPAVKDESRFPVDGRFVVSRTRDGGLTSEVLTRGLPTETSYDIVYRHGLAIDATGNSLATGSTTGHLWTTDNGGDDWQQLTAFLPPIYCVRFG
ncbi:MAG: exo-alpha-sialidase [Candidatus Saccharimonas sp.]|nr:exo-alpha-sialidase [Planctomycetaceae bacterium]